MSFSPVLAGVGDVAPAGVDEGLGFALGDGVPLEVLLAGVLRGEVEVAFVTGAKPGGVAVVGEGGEAVDVADDGADAGGEEGTDPGEGGEHPLGVEALVEGRDVLLKADLADGTVGFAGVPGGPEDGPSHRGCEREAVVALEEGQRTGVSQAHHRAGIGRGPEQRPPRLGEGEGAEGKEEPGDERFEQALDPLRAPANRVDECVASADEEVEASRGSRKEVELLGPLRIHEERAG